jgi:DNA (cytosine-5)-methyltransferase 1
MSDFFCCWTQAAGVSGTTDAKGTLFQEYVRILKLLQPQGFLFENVYGITGANGGEAWALIQEAFREVGYNIHFRILDAADYGVPQHRERLFIVGLKQGTYMFPYPTHGPDSLNQQPYYSAAKAVEGADILDIEVGLGGRFGHLLEDIPPGLNYSFYTREMGYPNPFLAGGQNSLIFYTKQIQILQCEQSKLRVDNILAPLAGKTVDFLSLN